MNVLNCKTNKNSSNNQTVKYKKHTKLKNESLKTEFMKKMT